MSHVKVNLFIHLDSKYRLGTINMSKILIQVDTVNNIGARQSLERITCWGNGYNSLFLASDGSNMAGVVVDMLKMTEVGPRMWLWG